MSIGQPTQWPGGSDDRLADDRHQGHMGRFAEPSATVASFAFEGAGSRRRIKVANATASVAGALTAADFALLARERDRPTCRVTHSAIQSVANATITALTFDTETFDTDGFHAGGTPTALVVPAGLAGLYLIGGTLAWSASAGGGRRLAQIRLNGTLVIARAEGMGNATTQPTLLPTTPYRLAVGEYVELTGFQDSGGALDAHTIAGAPCLWWIWMGE